MMYKPYLQDYDEIKQRLLESGEKFVDDQFPADDSSIYKLNKHKKK